MKVPDFPRIENMEKETEQLYDWCYKLYIALKKEEENGKEATLRENER